MFVGAQGAPRASLVLVTMVGLALGARAAPRRETKPPIVDIEELKGRGRWRKSGYKHKVISSRATRCPRSASRRSRRS